MWPRLWLGRLPDGSVVGFVGAIVWTEEMRTKRKPQRDAGSWHGQPPSTRRKQPVLTVVPEGGMVPSTPPTGVLGMCMDSYDVPGGEWSNNILSASTVRGPSGRMGLAREVAGIPEPAAVAAVQSLTAALLPLVPPLNGLVFDSEVEVFTIIGTPAWRCEELSPTTVSEMFGSALYPDAVVTVEPISKWIRRRMGELARTEQRLPLTEDFKQQWRPPLDWLMAPGRFEETAAVQINKPDPGRYEGGTVFPRMWIGRLADGSVVGMIAAVVWA